LPGPALAAAAGFLMQRDEPLAFDSAWVGKQVDIGRAGALDNADSAQNRLPAARSVSVPRGPISK